MLRTLVRVALGAALVAPLAACGKREAAAPASVVPDVPDPAEAAKEAAYRKHLDDGTKALAYGDTDAAVTHLKQAVSDKPGAADAHFQFGRALVAKKDDAEALKALTEAVRLDPRLADAYLERAAIHDRAGRLADAGYDYYRVIDIDSDRKTTARAYWLRSSIADRQGKRDTFLYDREQAMRLDPEYQKLVTAGDVRVFNHTDVKLKLTFERFVNPDGSPRKFPPGFHYVIPDDYTRYLLYDDRHMPARSVRYTITTSFGSRTYERAYEKGTALEIHIYDPDVPSR
jgi:tetratricopeptide (TPR) repeat protein